MEDNKSVISEVRPREEVHQVRPPPPDPMQLATTWFRHAALLVLLFVAATTFLMHLGTKVRARGDDTKRAYLVSTIVHGGAS